MDHQQALALVREVIASMEDIHVRLPVEEIRPEHELTAHLGIDSLGRIGFFYELTDRLETEVDEEVGEAWITLGDVLDFIEKAAK